MKHIALTRILAAARTRMKWIGLCALAVSILLAAAHSGQARALPGTHKPVRPTYKQADQASLPFRVYSTRLHYVGQVWLALTTWGMFGTPTQRIDPVDLEKLGIQYSPSFEFPAGTRNDYLYGGSIWIGGIVGTDTLVSIAMTGVSAQEDEWNSYDTVYERSSSRSSIFYDPEAKAEQEYLMLITDTVVLNAVDDLEGRPHRPLHLEVRQKSNAWSDLFARQFVTIEYWIKNIGDRPINKMAMGIYMDADVLNPLQSIGDPYNDDVSGLLDSFPSILNSTFNQALYTSWVGDNDGDPVGGTFPTFSPSGAVGIRILRAPPVRDFSFNWWLIGGTSAQDWGPAKAGSRPTTGSGGLGAPEGDRNMYYVMTNGEVDYGQLEANIDHTADGWRPPLRAGGCDIADGLDTRQAIAVGPTFDPLLPGDSMPFTVAFCGGNGLHQTADVTFDCTDPSAYIRSLDFDGLSFAASWASWVYDVPGLDTDGDGYRGEYWLANCAGGVCDTIWWCGDCGPPPGPGGERLGQRRSLDCVDNSKPDAPPCPEPVTIQTQPGEVIVRWSGENTEREGDFEGYRLFMSRIDSEELYALIAQWDIEDYFPMVYSPITRRFVEWSDPMTREQILADTAFFITELDSATFDPADWARPNLDSASCLRVRIFVPVVDTLTGETDLIPDERCAYLAPAFGNRGTTYAAEEGDSLATNLIRRVEADTIINPNPPYDTLVYGLYEARLTDLNPSIGNYVTVTAFDYGDRQLNLQSLESKRGAPGCTEFAIPINSADVVVQDTLDVSVFPNPYKISFQGPSGKQTTYFDENFEAPDKKAVGGSLDEQDRRIWFINLPPDATIKIFTLDGDLVREIDHCDAEFLPAGSPGGPPICSESDALTTDYSSRAYWDLITRNTQAVVSGIYIWRVDSQTTGRSQVGKLVVIK